MNTVNLFTIRIDSYQKINEEQLALIQEIEPEVRWKTEKEVKQSIYDSDSDEKKAEKETQNKKDWEDYQNATFKEFNSPYTTTGVDIVTLSEKLPFLKYTVESSKPVKLRATKEHIDKAVADLSELFKQFKQLAELPDVSNTYNNKCAVHIGGSLLMTVNDLMLVEDSCTDVIQTKLNEGWRIVACCVQSDSRRPDYILGRYNPDNDSIDEDAKRG